MILYIGLKIILKTMKLLLTEVLKQLKTQVQKNLLFMQEKHY